MPWKPKRPCSAPGCSELQPCPRHGAGRRPFADRKQVRVGWEWDRKRSAYIEERVATDGGCCERCRVPLPLHQDADGLWRGGEVHHRTRLAEGGSDDRANLELLCPPCHRAIATSGHRGAA